MMVLFGSFPVTRLAALSTLARNAGEGGPSPGGRAGEGLDRTPSDG
jgi:hypothetical protein